MGGFPILFAPTESCSDINLLPGIAPVVSSPTPRRAATTSGSASALPPYAPRSFRYSALRFMRFGQPSRIGRHSLSRVSKWCAGIQIAMLGEDPRSSVANIGRDAPLTPQALCLGVSGVRGHTPSKAGKRSAAHALLSTRRASHIPSTPAGDVTGGCLPFRAPPRCKNRPIQ